MPKFYDASLLAPRTGRIVVPPPEIRPEKTPPTDVEARHAVLSDLPETAAVSDDIRVRAGGFLRPSVELNAMRPVQTGAEKWLIRSHPVLVIRPDDMTLFTLPSGTVEAVCDLHIAYPYKPEYHMNDPRDGFVLERQFNAVDPNAGADAACSAGRVIPMTDFLIRGRVVIFPHPDATLTRFVPQIDDQQDRPTRFFTRFAASRTLYGAASAGLGTTTHLLEPHVIDGVSYGHTIAAGSGAGGGVLSDSDGLPAGAARAVGRRVDYIATDAGPAIIDIYARYPLTRYASGSGTYSTRSAWGVRLR